MKQCCEFKCNDLQIVSATLVQGVTAALTVAPETFINTCVYKLRYCVRFEDAVGTEVLQIISGGVTYNVFDKFGNPLTIGRLRRRELLCLRFSSIVNATTATVAHFTILNELCCPTIRVPEIEAAVAE